MPETVRISLRPATAADSRRLWELRNEETARRVSFDADVIPLDDHERWLAARLTQATQATAPIFMVGAPAAESIGYVRFDAVDGELRVSVALTPAARGRGLGPLALREAVAALRAQGRRERVVALIRPDNPRSLAAFRRAGFVVAGERSVAGTMVVTMGWPDE
jgi:RimJ/RimL family protein N-acetyltransferase